MTEARTAEWSGWMASHASDEPLTTHSVVLAEGRVRLRPMTEDD